MDWTDGALNYIFIHSVNKYPGLHFHESINKMMTLLCRTLYTLNTYTIHKNHFFQCTIIFAKNMLESYYRGTEYYVEILEIIYCEFLVELDTKSIGKILFAALIIQL